MSRVAERQGSQRSPVSQLTWRSEADEAVISSTPNVIGSGGRGGPIEPGDATAIERVSPELEPILAGLPSSDGRLCYRENVLRSGLARLRIASGDQRTTPAIPIAETLPDP